MWGCDMGWVLAGRHHLWVPGRWDGSPLGAWVLLQITPGCCPCHWGSGCPAQASRKEGMEQGVMVLQQRDEFLAAPPQQFGAIAKWVVGFSHRGKLRQRQIRHQTPSLCFATRSSMGMWGGAVRGCRFTKPPAPSSSNLLLLAGCSVARDRALLCSLSCMLNTPAPCRILQPSALLCCRGGGEAALAFQHSSRRTVGGGNLQDTALLPWTPSCGCVCTPNPPSSSTECAQPVLLLLRVLLQHNSLTPQGCAAPGLAAACPMGFSVFIPALQWVTLSWGGVCGCWFLL